MIIITLRCARFNVNIDKNFLFFYAVDVKVIFKNRILVHAKTSSCQHTSVMTHFFIQVNEESQNLAFSCMR